MGARHYTANIPFSKIIYMDIFNNQNTKYTMSKVYTMLKNTYPQYDIYLANCGFFSMSNPWFPVFGLKINGTVLANDWTQGGWIGLTGNSIGYGYKGTLPNNMWKTAVSGYPSLLEDGKRASSFSYCIDNSNRGRTMLGFGKNSVVLSCIEDISGNSDFTLDEEINYMIGQGCTYAINLDGGGSSQCNFNGQTIQSARLVNNFIYLVTEKSETGRKVVAEDGSWGPATTRYTQQMLGTTADGIISGQPACNKKFLPNCSTSSWRFYKTASGSQCIKKLQQLVKAGVDGYCGQGTVKAMQAFLFNQGLFKGTIDGYMNTDTVIAWQKYINNYFK